MYLYEYDYQLNSTVEVNVTLYIQIISAIALVFHCMGFLLATSNCVVAYRGLSYLNNRIDRRTQNQTASDFFKEIPESLFKQEISSFKG